MSALTRLAAVTLLVLCICTLQGHAENIEPFDSTYNLACSNAGGLVGAYKSASLNDTRLQSIGTYVYQEFLRQDDNETDCTMNAQNVKSNVTAACSQVVAGTNYALLVAGSHECSLNESTSSPIYSNATIAAKVYQPLGSAPPQITMLKLIALTQEEE